MYFYPHNKHNVNFGCLLLVWICKKPITLSYTYDAIQYYMIRTSMLDNMFTRGRQFKNLTVDENLTEYAKHFNHATHTSLVSAIDAASFQRRSKWG